MSRQAARAGEPRFPWTDELEAQVKRMFLEDGLSAGEIARRIGAPSRATVSGKLDRLGVKRGSGPSNPTPQARAAFSPPPPSRPAKAPSPAAADGEEVPRGEPNSPALLRVYRSSAPGSERVLAELPAGGCKWPLDPAGHPPADMRFCGGRQDGDGPYCSHHLKIAMPTARNAAQKAHDAKAVAALQATKRRRAA